MAEAFDLAESAWTRARARTSAWAGSRSGVLSFLGVGGAATALSTLYVTSHSWRSHGHVHHWSTAVQVIIPLGCLLFAGVFLFAVVDGVNFARAPLAQRDEARARLREIRDAAHDFRIVAENAYLALPGDFAGGFASDPLPAGTNLVGVLVRNLGRGAQFSVVIEHTSLATDFEHSYDYLSWDGRPGVVVEEIPTHEGRAIKVAYVQHQNPQRSGFEWTLVAPDGRTGSRWYSESETVTLWLRVSVRNVPEISYSRRVGVVIAWPFGDLLPMIELAPDPPDVETYRKTQSLTELLDY